MDGLPISRQHNIDFFLLGGNIFFPININTAIGLLSGVTDGSVVHYSTKPKGNICSRVK